MIEASVGKEKRSDFSHCGPLLCSVNVFGEDFWSKRVAVRDDFFSAY